MSSDNSKTSIMKSKKTHEVLQYNPLRLLQLICPVLDIVGVTKEKILECEKSILDFWEFAVLQKHGSDNGSSDKKVHLPPLFFIDMNVSRSVSNAMNEMLHKPSVDNIDESKRKASSWERQVLQQVRKLNPAIRPTSYTVFVSQLPQYQEFQKVKVTKKSTILKVPLDIEGGLSMIANGINGELQAYCNKGIYVVYLADDYVGLKLITAKDPGFEGQASEITQPKVVKKRIKY